MIIYKISKVVIHPLSHSNIPCLGQPQPAHQPHSDIAIGEKQIFIFNLISSDYIFKRFSHLSHYSVLIITHHDYTKTLSPVPPHRGQYHSVYLPYVANTLKVASDTLTKSPGSQATSAMRGLPLVPVFKNVGWHI